MFITRSCRSMSHSWSDNRWVVSLVGSMTGVTVLFPTKMDRCVVKYVLLMYDIKIHAVYYLSHA